MKNTALTLLLLLGLLLGDLAGHAVLICT